MRRFSALAIAAGLSALIASVPVQAEPPADVLVGQQPAASAADGPAGETTPSSAAETAAPNDTIDKQAAAEAAQPAPPPEPTLLINIDLTKQRMVVTENGSPRYTWAISSGAYGYPTPVGTFRPSWMAKMWYSKQYDNAPMPHSIFFHGGAAIHATSSIHLLGTPASHGCVRLSPSNAARLYAMVGRHGKDHTEITVHGRPKYTAPRIARVQPAYPAMRYAYSPFDYGSGYGYQPYSAPPRYYLKSSRQRANALKKRRSAVREYYSAY
jgi:lipoprotein-anchoring transpeptidase ErfK/SrfK